MFNDLNSSNNQSRPAVDDIFAETDKATEGAAPSPALGNSGIETRRVGLTATDGMIKGEAERGANNKWFKIILIVIVVAIVLLSGYLAYSRFFKPGLNNTAGLNSKNSALTNKTATSTAAVVPATDSNNSGSFVTPTNGSPVVAATTTIPEIPGVNAPVAPLTTTTTPAVATTTVNSSVDSDSDGLSDAEEKVAGTNINVIDTDNDGLSDYEEVKIYRTNPLSADTDGDGYLDGAEVKGGYDPNVKGGKLIKPVK